MKRVFALILVMALVISCCPGISVQASVQNEKPKDPLLEDNSKENAELNPGGFKPSDQESGDLESGDVIESTDPVDPALPKDVQEKIVEAAKMREKTAEYITGGYCPLCDGEVTWTRSRTTISVSGGAVSHRYMTGNLSLTTSGYPIRVQGSGTKLHLILYDAKVQFNGMIQVGNDTSENVELAIIGNGSISTTGTKGENNNKTIGQGLFRLRGESPL